MPVGSFDIASRPFRNDATDLRLVVAVAWATAPRSGAQSLAVHHIESPSIPSDGCRNVAARFFGIQYCLACSSVD